MDVILLCIFASNGEPGELNLVWFSLIESEISEDLEDSRSLHIADPHAVFGEYQTKTVSTWEDKLRYTTV